MIRSTSLSVFDDDDEDEDDDDEDEDDDDDEDRLFEGERLTLKGRAKVVNAQKTGTSTMSFIGDKLVFCST